ncbi:pro-neuregulin-3, membrane-bound isoform-like [Neosynchiropus ocellatus]
MRTTFGIGLVTSSISLNPTVLHDSTPMWTREPTTTETATLSTRSHGHRKTSSPTVPSLHSEHFKPCHEKDLAYCLNDGECFVIETLSGPHKHCKCREGHQGIRCDQFLPKTDTVLSGPNHLGIEFMESQGVYKRQVLSITSITMAISLLGTLCVALYCRTKRRREKLHAQLKESRSLINYTTTCGDSKTRYHGNMQTHEEEAVLLLQQAQEQLRALAHWGQEVGSAPPLVAARETVVDYWHRVHIKFGNRIQIPEVNAEA